MIRPSSLLRSNSDGSEEPFSAPRGDPASEIDCGLTNIACTQKECLHRFATAKWYIFFVVIAAMLQGAATQYFRSTSYIFASHFNFSYQLVEYMILGSEVFQAILAVIVSFLGNKYHRSAWFGALLCMQGVACFVAIIPFFTHRDDLIKHDIPAYDPNMLLCYEEDVMVEKPEFTETCVGSFIIFLIVHIFFGLSKISFLSHGLTYIDDNVSGTSSPTYLGLGLAGMSWGPQLGILLTWTCMRVEHSTDFGIKVKSTEWWFGWPFLGCLFLLFGTIISMYPRKMLNTVINEIAGTLLNFARGSKNRYASIKKEPGFCVSIKRTFSNKPYLMNTLAFGLAQTAYLNFNYYEESFNEAMFHVPKKSISPAFKGPWITNTITDITQYAIVTTMCLLSGFVIAKVHPRARALAAWNVLCLLIMSIIFFTYTFLNCNDKLVGENSDSLNIEYCGHKCKCPSTIPFSPVCTVEGYNTFYSPCHAGCRNVSIINDVLIYGQCSCGNKPELYKLNQDHLTVATEGVCSNKRCTEHWMVFLVTKMIGSGLMGSAIVSCLLITLRVVNPLDKALSVGFSVGIIKLLTFLPGKMFYDFLDDKTCIHKNEETGACNLHKYEFANVICFFTGSLFLASILAALVVFWLVAKLPMYTTPTLDKINRPNEKKRNSSEMREIQTNLNRNNTNDSNNISENNEQLNFNLNNGLSPETREGEDNSLDQIVQVHHQDNQDNETENEQNSDSIEYIDSTKYVPVSMNEVGLAVKGTNI